ncbi:MAG: hypothetical protein L0Z53_16215 [Acidobacteriales bacterium]|nr:hypothetical protein [Terriglobales bacterium]
MNVHKRNSTAPNARVSLTLLSTGAGSLKRMLGGGPPNSVGRVRQRMNKPPNPCPDESFSCERQHVAKLLAHDFRFGQSTADGE